MSEGIYFTENELIKKLELVQERLKDQEKKNPMWEQWPALTAMKQISLDIKSEIITDIEELIKHLPEQESGWMRLQSKNVLLPDHGPLSAHYEEGGYPLEGEWVDKDGISYRLNRNEPRQWMLTKYTAGQGELYLEQETIKLYGARGAKTLNYKVYWSSERGDPTAMKRIASRFVGFGEEV